MQVMFLIGNGFDLNLGLKTRFSDFFPTYLAIPAEDSTVQEFKNLLEQDQDKFPHWSNFERALGLNTDIPPLNTSAGILTCIRDFEYHFSRYLQEQQSLIDFDHCEASMLNKLRNDLRSHLNLLPSRPAAALRDALPTDELVSYNILNFNYTTILDRLFSPPRPSFLGKHIHVHGTFSLGMILGVDNLKQIMNPKVFANSDQQRMLLKPLLNRQFDQNNDEEALGCIEASDEICIFGMSLGETDLTWWQRIHLWLKDSPNHHLLIFSRGSGLAPLYPYDTITHQEKLTRRFLSFANALDPKVSSRVHVIITDQLFNLSPILTPAPAPVSV